MVTITATHPETQQSITIAPTNPRDIESLTPEQQAALLTLQEFESNILALSDSVLIEKQKKDTIKVLQALQWIKLECLTFQQNQQQGIPESICCFLAYAYTHPEEEQLYTHFSNIARQENDKKWQNIRTHNGVSVHLWPEDAKDPAASINNLLNIISLIEQGYRKAVELNKVPQLARKFYVGTADIGCMEERTKEAIEYSALLLENGDIESLDDLYDDLQQALANYKTYYNQVHSLPAETLLPEITECEFILRYLLPSVDITFSKPIQKNNSANNDAEAGHSSSSGNQPPKNEQKLFEEIIYSKQDILAYCKFIGIDLPQHVLEDIYYRACPTAAFNELKVFVKSFLPLNKYNKIDVLNFAVNQPFRTPMGSIDAHLIQLSDPTLYRPLIGKHTTKSATYWHPIFKKMVARDAVKEWRYVPSPEGSTDPVLQAFPKCTETERGHKTNQARSAISKTPMSRPPYDGQMTYYQPGEYTLIGVYAHYETEVKLRLIWDKNVGSNVKDWLDVKQTHHQPCYDLSILDKKNAEARAKGEIPRWNEILASPNAKSLLTFATTDDTLAGRLHLLNASYAAQEYLNHINYQHPSLGKQYNLLICRDDEPVKNYSSWMLIDDIINYVNPKHEQSKGAQQRITLRPEVLLHHVQQAALYIRPKDAYIISTAVKYLLLADTNAGGRATLYYQLILQYSKKSSSEQIQLLLELFGKLDKIDKFIDYAAYLATKNITTNIMLALQKLEPPLELPLIFHMFKSETALFKALKQSPPHQILYAYKDYCGQENKAVNLVTFFNRLPNSSSKTQLIIQCCSDEIKNSNFDTLHKLLEYFGEDVYSSMYHLSELYFLYNKTNDHLKIRENIFFIVQHLIANNAEPQLYEKDNKDFKKLINTHAIKKENASFCALLIKHEVQVNKQQYINKEDPPEKSRFEKNSFFASLGLNPLLLSAIFLFFILTVPFSFVMQLILAVSAIIIVPGICGMWISVVNDMSIQTQRVNQELTPQMLAAANGQQIKLNTHRQQYTDNFKIDNLTSKASWHMREALKQLVLPINELSKDLANLVKPIKYISQYNRVLRYSYIGAKNFIVGGGQLLISPLYPFISLVRDYKKIPLGAIIIKSVLMPLAGVVKASIGIIQVLSAPALFPIAALSLHIKGPQRNFYQRFEDRNSIKIITNHAKTILAEKDKDLNQQKQRLQILASYVHNKLQKAILRSEKIELDIEQEMLTYKKLCTDLVNKPSLAVAQEGELACLAADHSASNTASETTPLLSNNMGKSTPHGKQKFNFFANAETINKKKPALSAPATPEGSDEIIDKHEMEEAEQDELTHYETYFNLLSKAAPAA